MVHTLQRLTLPGVLLVVGLAAGFAFGQRQGLQMGEQFLSTELDGTLAIHVEAASAVRVGDTERALMLLDTLIDGAIVSHPLTGQPRVLKALTQAKAYRSVVPATGRNADEVRAVLGNVPAADPSERPASGLARLVEKSKQ